VKYLFIYLFGGPSLLLWILCGFLLALFALFPEVYSFRVLFSRVRFSEILSQFLFCIFGPLLRAKILLRSLHSAAAATTPFFIFFLFCVATICLGFCFCFWFKKKKSFSSYLHKRKKNSRLHPTLTWRASRFHTAKYLWVFIYHLLNFWFLRGSGGDGERRVELGSSSSFLPFVFGLLLFSSGRVFAFVNLLCHDQKFSSFLAFACVCLCV